MTTLVPVAVARRVPCVACPLRANGLFRRFDADELKFVSGFKKGELVVEAGAMVLSGMCFYQSYAREMAEANGWRRLVTNSAKLTNILGGYGYRPALLPMAACVDAACSGRIGVQGIGAQGSGA